MHHVSVCLGLDAKGEALYPCTPWLYADGENTYTLEAAATHLQLSGKNESGIPHQFTDHRGVPLGRNMHKYSQKEAQYLCQNTWSF